MLKQKIQQLELKITQVLPNIPALQARVQHLTTQALLDPTKKGDLFDANEQVKQAEEAHARRAKDIAQLNAMRQELSMAEAEARTLAINTAAQQVAALRADFNSQAKALCRLYEQMHALNRRYEQTVPGYRSARLPDFDFPMMTPAGWVGVTSEHIRTNALAWLNSEKQKVA